MTNADTRSKKKKEKKRSASEPDGKREQGEKRVWSFFGEEFFFWV